MFFIKSYDLVLKEEDVIENEDSEQKTSKKRNKKLSKKPEKMIWRDNVAHLRRTQAILLLLRQTRNIKEENVFFLCLFLSFFVCLTFFWEKSGTFLFVQK